MSVRIEWVRAAESTVTLVDSTDRWDGADQMDPDEQALTMWTGGNLVAVYGTPEQLQRWSDRIRDQVRDAVGHHTATIHTPKER